MNKCRWFFPSLVAFGFSLLLACHSNNNNPGPGSPKAPPADSVWRGRPVTAIPLGSDSGDMIRYGHDLIENTSYYFGPRGKVSQTTNGMNCQNCHLAAGTLPFGNNYGKTYSTYPQYRPRNNGIQSIYMRIQDCFQRSLNGAAPDSNSREMKAMYAYMKWLGTGVPRGTKPAGTGIYKLAFMKRAASLENGLKVYNAVCKVCHGERGQGLLKPDSNSYQYPPLWGPHSFNDGAGLYRVSNLAGYAWANMPFGINYKQPKLSVEEAWDVAAYINSQKRPHLNQDKDWANLSKKPIDFPKGPYLDTFSENQHKYGPWKPIEDFYKQHQEPLSAKK